MYAAIRRLEPAAAADFEEMLRGYTNRLLARNCKATTVTDHERILRKLVDRFGLPWTWQRAQWERYQAERRDAGLSVGTLRGEQEVVRGFSAYLRAAGWDDYAKRQYGAVMAILIDEENSIVHAGDYEASRNVRPATRLELRSFFAFMEQQIDQMQRHHDKGAVTAYRDLVIFKTIYAYGLRRSEALALLDRDFRPNPYIAEFGPYAVLRVKNGKAKPFGPPRPRVVFLTGLMQWHSKELIDYLRDVRPLFHSRTSDHLFVATCGTPLMPGSLTQSFAKWRDLAGLPRDLTVHSLRRSHATHHVEARYAGAFIKDQLGHEWESSTADYVILSDDFRYQQLLEAQDFLPLVFA